ncbi:sensor histidine kinase [Pseudoduganella sp. OTU4001]|uniref:sensor histidine kinase n=1 Tax=Pseudoduganella sp. OTU4001 TaxID=3043854 RepID=UPI00313CBAF5
MRKFASRMYVRIYAALLACLVIAAALFAFIHLWIEPARHVHGFSGVDASVDGLAPPAGASQEELQRALIRWRRELKADLALYGADGRQLGTIGRPLPGPDLDMRSSGVMPAYPSVFAFKLPDGRWLIAQKAYPHNASAAMLVLLLMIAATVAVGAYPVVRRITSGLEQLQRSVQAWGRGDLAARVPVQGRDEVAQLAASFNESAARIEALVGAQKSLLANASHELRSPLARIRMAVELLEDSASPAMRQELGRNISELDQLIDELLLASRLDAAPADSVGQEEVDFTGIVAEECARVGAALDGVAGILRGDATLLRRMVRNLLENAKRHGGSAQVSVALARDGDGDAGGGMASVRLEVCDGGPGVPPEERERIFEPFYRLPGASEKAGSVGLGLALVRQIARRHGGEVECLPNGARGACFRVRLPSGGRTSA